MGILVVMAAWVMLYAYLVAYTAPPWIVSAVLLLPILALGWTLAIARRRSVWEANETGLWKRHGTESRLLAEWGHVVALEAGGRPGSPNVSLVIRTTKPNGKIRLLAGSGINRDGVRTLYEASAYYLKRRGIEGSNPFGWRNLLPLVAKKPTTGADVNWTFHAGLDLILGGAIALPESIQQTVEAQALVAGVMGLGGALLLLGIGRMRRRAGAREPEYRVNE